MNNKKYSFKAIVQGALLFGGVLAFTLTSCNKNGEDPTPKGKGPIVLECDYFQEDRVLKDNPDAPVDYIINCVMDVGDAEIVVEPGVVIEFDQDAGIRVDAFNKAKCAFTAIGTADKPIVFKGKTNSPGFWRGIYFESESTKNELSFVKIQDAGGKAFNSNGDEGSLILYSGTKAKITNSEITNGMSYAVNAIYKSVDVVLENNTFTGNKSPGIFEVSLVDILKPSNSFAGNTEDFISLENYTAPISEASTLYKNDVKYRVVRTKGGYKTTEITNTLTIQPGVEIEFPQEHKIKISGNGALKAVGNETAPIIFRGVDQVAKGWVGVYIESKSAVNEIAFAEFHHSGLNAPAGNIHLWYEAALNIHDVQFKNINGCAINYKLFSGKTENPNLTIGSNITSTQECIENEWD